MVKLELIVCFVGIKFKVIFEICDFIVIVDIVKLEWVLINLIENVICYILDGGVILVSVFE